MCCPGTSPLRCHRCAWRPNASHLFHGGKHLSGFDPARELTQAVQATLLRWELSSGLPLSSHSLISPNRRLLWERYARSSHPHKACETISAFPTCELIPSRAPRGSIALRMSPAATASTHIEALAKQVRIRILAGHIILSLRLDNILR